MRRWNLLVVVCLGVLLSGCPRSPEDTAPVIELEPLYITILKKGDSVEVKDYDTGELFQKAEKAFAEGRITEAKKLYAIVAKDSPEAEGRGVAWFNIALCELALEQPGAALEALARAEKVLAGDALQVQLLKVRALGMLGEWDQVKTEGSPLLEEELEPLWRAQLHVYLGQAAFLEDLLEESDRHYRASLDLILSHTPLKEQRRNRLLADVYFHQGKVYGRLFRKLSFKMPVERMMFDMTDKLALMRQAEEIYLAAVRVRDEKWSPRAGFEVASLYESFATELLRAEVPPDLEPLELQVYTEELNKKVVPFLLQAKDIHEKNAGMCTTYGLKSQWQERSTQKAAQIGELIASLSKKDPTN